MRNIWFTSDTHYHHKNIVQGTTAWEGTLDKCRPFKTLDEHDSTLVNNINQLVKPGDVLYHLGDWSFGGHEQIKLFRDRIACQEIHLILGNHDQHIEPMDSPYRSLFASVQHYKEITIKNVEPALTKYYGKHKIVLSHFAMRVWNKSHHGSIMLHGHSHGSLPMYSNGKKVFRTMDVGVDTNNLYPYHLTEVLDIMYERESCMEVDHHSKHTN